MRFEVPLLVEAPAADGAAVRFLSGVNQLMSLQFVRVREFFAAHGAVVVDLLFGRLQELGRDFHWHMKSLPARTLLPYAGQKKKKVE